MCTCMYVCIYIYIYIYVYVYVYTSRSSSIVLRARVSYGSLLYSLTFAHAALIIKVPGLLRG